MNTVVYFTFWRHGINFNLPKWNMNKNEGEIPATWQQGPLGVSCEPWEIHKRNLHNPTNEDCWVWKLIFLGSHFWSTSNWWCLLDFHGISYGFWNPCNWRSMSRSRGRSRQPPGLKRWVFEEAGKSEVTGRLIKVLEIRWLLGWWFQFQTVFYVHPKPWGNDSIWRAYFSNGLVQPPTIDYVIRNLPGIFR